MTEQEKELLDRMMAVCQQEGISPTQIDFDTHTENKVVFSHGEIKNEKSNDIYRVRCLGLFDDKQGYYETDVFDESIVDEMVAAIKESSKDGRISSPGYFGKPLQRYGKADTWSAKLSTIETGTLEIINKNLVNAIKRTNALFDDQALNEVSTTFIIGRRMMVNSLGLKAEKKYDRIEMLADCTLTNEKGEKSTAIEKMIEYKGLDKIKPDYLANRIEKEIMTSFNVGSAIPGKYKVMLSPRSAATILHIADLHLSGKMISEGTSVYSDSFGKDVFSPLLTILNDPFMASSQCTPFDREGNPTEKFMAIDHGRLRCFFLDTEYGEKLNMRANGCATYGMPESQYFVVAPSADNKVNDLIRKTGEGYIVEGFDAESVEKTKKDANINIDLPFYGYQIEGGKLGRAVRGTLKGKADDMLRNVVALSQEREDCSKECALCTWFVIDGVEIE